MRQVLAAISIALLLSGCEDSSPTEPLPAVPTPVGVWILTTQVTDARGSSCIALPPVGGGPFQTTFALTRFGDTATFHMADPDDWVGYTVTIHGTEFSGQGGGGMENYPCGK